MRIFYFGEPGRRLFAALSSATSAAQTGLVIAPPFGEEMICTYARLAQWGKELAEQGFAMLRYHPLGTGESDGIYADFTPGQAASDAAAAVDWLRRNLCVERVGLLGVRFGATVAVRAAQVAQPDFLILWSPVIHLQQYFRELLRLRLTKELVHQRANGVRTTARSLVERLEAEQSIDVIGYEISPEFYRQISADGWWPEEPPAGSVLWVDRARDGSKSGPVVERWRKHGAKVEFALADEPVFWEDFSAGLPHQFIDISLRWMLRGAP